jgi:hypothetical protein
MPGGCVAVTMAKLSSSRCPYKLLRPLLRGESLLARHFSLFTRLRDDWDKFCYTRDPEVAAMAKDFGLQVIDRSTLSTRHNATFCDVWLPIAQMFPDVNDITWVNACCPFLRPETVIAANSEHFHINRNPREGRIVLPTIVEEMPFWGANGTAMVERKQMGTAAMVQRLSHAFWVRTPQQITDAAESEEAFARQHREAYLIPIASKFEQIDVDTEQDFAMAQAVAQYLSQPAKDASRA